MVDRRKVAAAKRIKGGGSFVLRESHDGKGWSVYQVEVGGRMILLQTFGSMREALGFVAPLGGRVVTNHKPD